MEPGRRDRLRSRVCSDWHRILTGTCARVVRWCPSRRRWKRSKCASVRGPGAKRGAPDRSREKRVPTRSLPDPLFRDGHSALLKLYISMQIAVGNRSLTPLVLYIVAFHTEGTLNVRRCGGLGGCHFTVLDEMSCGKPMSLIAKRKRLCFERSMNRRSRRRRCAARGDSRNMMLIVDAPCSAAFNGAARSARGGKMGGKMGSARGPTGPHTAADPRAAHRGSALGHGAAARIRGSAHRSVEPRAAPWIHCRVCTRAPGSRIRARQ